MTRLCKACGSLLEGRPNKLYCNERCVKAWERNHASETTYSRTRRHLSPTTVGALHELYVCSDLLKKGYEVFRSVSPSASCDVLVLDIDKQLRRVEITTGHESRTEGNLGFPPKNSKKFDLLAVVLDIDKPIRYFVPEEVDNIQNQRRHIQTIKGVL